MRRRVEPELLDSLPADDPGAIGSRRDLARINRIMGQHRIVARELARVKPFSRLVDLGGGDGRFLLAVAQRLPPFSCQAWIADRQDILGPATAKALAVRGWRVSPLK